MNGNCFVAGLLEEEMQVEHIEREDVRDFI